MLPEIPEDNLVLEECSIVPAPAGPATHRASDKRVPTRPEREEPRGKVHPRKVTKEQLADRGREQQQIPSKGRKQGGSIDVHSARTWYEANLSLLLRVRHDTATDIKVAVEIIRKKHTYTSPDGNAAARTLTARRPTDRVVDIRGNIGANAPWFLHKRNAVQTVEAAAILKQMRPGERRPPSRHMQTAASEHGRWRPGSPAQRNGGCHAQRPSMWNVQGGCRKRRCKRGTILRHHHG